jgi:hypothetical protein
MIQVAALLAMLAGTAMQYKASTDAAKRARQESLRAMQRQDDFNRQAEKKALDQAQDFSTEKRQDEQSQIEEEMTQEMLAPVESANQINAQTETTQGDVSNDYKAAKVKSEQNLKDNANKLASLMARVNSASRLRGNEAIRMADTAAGIDRLGNFAKGMQGVDNYTVSQAARPDAGLVLGGQMLQGVGMLGLGGKAPGTETTQGVVASSKATGSLAPIPLKGMLNDAAVPLNGSFA